MGKNRLQKHPPAKSITLALDSQIVDVIKREAVSEGRSLNAKVNEILSRHAIFYKHALLQESVFIPREIYAQILEIVDEEKNLELLMRALKEVMPSVYSHNNVRLSTDDLVQFLGTFTPMTGMISSFRYYHDDESLRLVFEHKYGPKWSRILATALTSMIRAFVSSEPEVKVMPYTIVVGIPKDKGEKV